LEEIAPQTAVSAALARGLHYAFVKRLIDIGLCAVGLVVLSPVFLAIGLAIALDSGAPVLFRCVRIGQYGRPITVYKFRTMRDGSHHHLQHLLTADEELRLEYDINRKLRQDPRRTRVGIFLRRTSLDELPQLLNVLFGDMSLVGPRPTAPGELDERRERAEILQVRPGITGLWQVNGRSERTFEERLAFDVDYVRRRSLWFDLTILVRTVGAVVSGRGAY
jgi:lipopolysaccharide/colanic/teichoic acid biosynthesis glycosyltransferase